MESESKSAKKENPRVRANPFSALIFLYMIPIFWKNYRKDLNESDLYDVLDEHKSSKLGNELERVWTLLYKKYPNYALHGALLRMHWFELAYTGLLKLIIEIAKIVVLPFAIGKLVSYFEHGPPDITECEAYVYGGLVVFINLLDSLIGHPIMFCLTHIAMKMRVSCCSLIYRKCLRLSRDAMQQTTVGQVVNLLSNDVRKFDEGIALTHFLWIAPVQTIVGTYMLYRLIGISAFSGIGFLLLFIPLQAYLGKLTSAIRLKTATRTDERVRLMNEILSGIHVIKLYTWEKPFAKLVAAARRYEIKATRVYFYIQATLYSIDMFATQTSIFITIIVYIYLGNSINANLVFSAASIYYVIRISLMKFSISLGSCSAIHISVVRLQRFLCYDEQQKPTNYIITNYEPTDKFIEKIEFFSPRISMKNVSAKWNVNASEFTLTDINLTFESGQLVTIIGPVGGGKTTIMSIILRELEVSNGFLDVRGNVSYASQEPWLFLSSVKQNILFGEKFNENRYRNVIKACALESDFNMLPYGDRTLVGEKGKALSGGQKARVSLARALYRKADIYLLDDPLSAVDTKVGKHVFDNCIKNFLRDKICILITHQLQYIKDADKIVIVKEGRILADGNLHDLQQKGLYLEKLVQLHAGYEQDNKGKDALEQNSEITCSTPKDTLLNKEIVASGNIQFGTYWAYFRTGGNVCMIFLLIFGVAASHFIARLGDYFLAYWVNLEQTVTNKTFENSTLARNTAVYYYSGITITTIIVTLSSTLYFFLFFMQASINIHKILFDRIAYAPMRFFNNNSTGRILNRFSKDMGIIDEYIPIVIMDVLNIALLIMGTVVLITVVNPLLLVPSLTLIGVFHVLRIVYLHTSRTVKRIEGVARTPIFNHTTATLNGLSTIRTFNMENLLIEEFDNHQDLHSSAWYLFLLSSRSFGLFVDSFSVVFLVFVINICIALNKGYYGGDIGLIITQLINFSNMTQWGMRQYAELENNMTSVERVLEYTKTETEPIRKPITSLPKTWPECGKIEFQQVSMKYNPNEARVLKNLNFVLYPSEKIGVVGRTGAGKSSTIAALFQLYDIEGSIIIDDLDTTKLPLDILRSKISIIPQEPVLFSGTLRKNLDPFEEFDDEELWKALEQVELKKLVEDFADGLSNIISESGSNFSIGQKQLICLARAIIRNNKILVMDEATANVDMHTDFLIQKTIKKNFAGCTVITVAHRLHTIMDSDKVMVMDQGEVLEFDPPSNLLQKTDSIFYSMVKVTGNDINEKIDGKAKQSIMELKT